MSQCEHPETEIRKRYDKLKRRHYVEQCLTCGSALRAVKADGLGLKVLSMADFDENLSAEYWGDLLAKNREASNDAFQDYHADYMQSEEWAWRREAVLSRDQQLCRGCLKNRATQVHHLTYDHLGEEPLFDLVAICRECHRNMHAQERDWRENGKPWEREW